MYYIWHNEDGVSVICIITRTLSRGLMNRSAVTPTKVCEKK